MNRIYRSVWNEISRTFVAAAETVRGRGKPSSGICTDRAMTLASRSGAVLARRRPMMLALEQRFMFDGAAVAPVADAAAAAAEAHAAIAAIPAAVEVRAADPVKDGGKKEVVFVDTSVADYKSLEAGIRDGVAIVEIDGAKDGLAQIAKWAESHSGYDSISILGHGSEATLNLGTTALTTASLGSSVVQSELAEVGQSLTTDGDILLYGCDVAKGTDGEAFVAALASATGADVAASNDRTGAASLSGDWVLEKQIGTTIDNGIFDQGVDYDHLLSAPAPSNYFYARPGEVGTSWIVPSTYTSSGTTVTDITGLKISVQPTTGVFEYSTDGTLWSAMTTETSLTPGQYLRFRDTASSTTTYDTSTWLFWYGTVNGSAGSYSENAVISADNAPSALTANTADIWGSSATGDTLATLNLTDSGMDAGTGRYVIESQSVANLFALGTSGTYTTLVRGTGSLPTAGLSATVTVRYYDYWQLDASGDPIAGQGVATTFTFTSRADPAGFATETHVNTETAYSQTAPASAQLSDGSYVVVWTSTLQGSDTVSNAGIYAQKYSSSGDKIGSEIAISDQSVDKNDFAPTVTALDDGKYVVAYTQKNTDNDIVIRVVAADGTLGNEILAPTSSTGIQNTASIAKLSNGNFVVSWVTPGVSTDISARVFDSNGAALAGSEFTVNATTALGQILPSVAGLTDGNYVVVWRDASNASNNGDVYGRVMSASGAVSDEIKIAEGTKYQTVAKVTALTGGGFVVVFQEAGNTEGSVVDGASVFNIYAQRYDSGGSAQGSRILVNASVQGNQTTSTVSALGNGGFVVAWVSNSDPGATNDVFARRFDASGNATDAYDLLVNENGRTGNQTAPNVAALGTADGFTVSWSDPNGDASESLTAGKIGVLNRAFVVVPGPTITSAATASFAENGSGAAYTAAATGSGTVAYGISGADAGLFSIDSSSGAVSFKTSPNYEAPGDSGADNVYDITVSATDASGTRSKNVSITVSDVNEAPAVTSGASTSVAENTAATVYAATASDVDTGQTLTYSLTGTDASLFNINASTGAVSFKTAPNYEAPGDAGGNNVYDINVVATDNGTGALTASKAVAITVTNVVEVPATTVATAHLSADTGSSPADFITKTASQTISGTLSANLASGERVQVSFDGGSNWSDANTSAVGSSSWSTTTTLSGSNTFLARVTNADGSSSAYTHSYTLDASAPVTPGTPVLASDTGLSSSDNITSVTTPTISGTAENGSTVTIYDGATLLGTVTAGAGGWSFTSGVLGNGSHSLSATATDTAGNVSAASGALSMTVDTAAPATASLTVPANGTYYTGQSLDFAVNFDEAVTVDTAGGTPRIALVVGASTRYADYVSGSGTSALVFRYVVPNGDSDSNGITVGALSANGGSLKDAAGNNATVTLNSVGSTTGINVDGSQPSVTGVSASTADGAYRVGQTITLTVNFSSAVTVSGGTPTLALADGATATYTGGSGSSVLTFSYTVGAGQNSADLDYSSVSALALNGATIVETGGSHQAASLTLAVPGTSGSLAAAKDIVIDTVAPSATIALSDPSLRIGETAAVTITFSEAVSGFTLADLSVADGTLNGLSTSDNIAWTATFTPNNNVSDTSNVVTLANAGVSDAAGNAGAGVTASANYAVDTQRPSATIVVADSTLAAGETSRVTITFSEAVTGFTNNDLTVANGTLSGLSSSDGGVTWTAMLTPTTSVSDATNLISLNNSGVTDLAGNAGSGSTDSNNYTVSTVRPTATIVVTDSALKAGETSLVTITFSEAVTGFTNADLAVANGTLSAVTSTDSGITWTATLTPGDHVADSSNVITLNTAGVASIAGSAGAGTVLSNNYAVDSVRPSATIVLSDSSLAAGETAKVTITFSEAVSGFSNANLTVVNGTLSAVTSADGGTTWTATLTPSTSVTDASNVITLNYNGVQDGAGNSGSGSVTSANYAVLTARALSYSATTLAEAAANDGSVTSTLTITLANATFSGADGSALGTVSNVPAGLTAHLTRTDATHARLSLTGKASAHANAQDISNLTVSFADADFAGSQAAAVAGATTTLAIDFADPVAAPPPPVNTPPLPPALAAAIASGQTVTTLASTSQDVASAQVSFLAPTSELAIGAATGTLAGALTTTTAGSELGVAAGGGAGGTGGAAVGTTGGAGGATGERPGASPLAPAQGGQGEGGDFQLAVASSAVSPTDGLVVNRGVADQSLASGSASQFAIPADAFATGSANAVVSLFARQSDGRPLPGWLRFDPATGKFEGQPPPGFAGEVTIRVTARDAQGHEAVITFKVKVGRASGGEGTRAQPERSGRAGLSEQLRLMGRPHPALDRLARIAALRNAA